MSRAPVADTRLWRAAALAGATAAITALGHTLGGPTSGCSDLAAPILLVFGMAFVLARGVWTTRRVFLMLLAGQVGFHVVTWIGSTSPDQSLSARMVGTHAVAALVAAWVLQRGDAACERLVRILSAVAPRVLRPVAAERRRALVSIEWVGIGMANVNAHTLNRRGPPVGFTFARS